MHRRLRCNLSKRLRKREGNFGIILDVYGGFNHIFWGGNCKIRLIRPSILGPNFENLPYVISHAPQTCKLRKFRDVMFKKGPKWSRCTVHEALGSIIRIYRRHTLELSKIFVLYSNCIPLYSNFCKCVPSVLPQSPHKPSVFPESCLKHSWQGCLFATSPILLLQSPPLDTIIYNYIYIVVSIYICIYIYTNIYVYSHIFLSKHFYPVAGQNVSSVQNHFNGPF